MSVELNFDELEKAFSKMTGEERDAITAVHPLLDGLTIKQGAKLLCVSESVLHLRLNTLINKFSLTDPRLTRQRAGGARGEKTYSGRDEKMEEFAKTFDLDPMEYEFIKLVHPIFDVDMTREQACETLGWSIPTGIRIWKSLLKRFPELEESMEKWVNTAGVSRHNFENPMMFGDFDDPYFGDDTIVSKF